MLDPKLQDEEASVRATALSAYTAMAESNKNRRLNLLTIVPVGSLITMIGTIWGGSNNQALTTLSLPIGIFGILLVIGLFYIALGATRHDEEYQTVIRALGSSLYLPLLPKPTHYAPKVISFLFATSIGSLVCTAAWFVLPGFGILTALLGAVLAGLFGTVIVRR